MKSLPVIACTLDPAARRLRGTEWAGVLRRATARDEIACGARYVFPADDALERRVRDLAAAEGQCCSFYRFELERTAASLTMTVTAPPEAQGALRQLFAPRHEPGSPA
jgi:hypothetical protein